MRTIGVRVNQIFSDITTLKAEAIQCQPLHGAAAPRRLSSGRCDGTGGDDYSLDGSAFFLL